MSRRKQKEKKRRQKRQQKQQKSQAAGLSGARDQSDLDAIDLSVRHPELAHPAVYIDSCGQRIADPYATLGIEPKGSPTPERIQSAFRGALAATCPEAEPERARELLEARDFLLDPQQVMGRTLGDLRVPDPQHFVPGYEPRSTRDSSAQAGPAVDWSSRTRLVALMSLYALLEEEIERGSPPEVQGGFLFD